MSNKELQVLDVIESAGLEQDTTKTLREKFLPFWEQAEKWREIAENLVVTDESQTREMKMAREARLALRAIRVDADKTRKALKEDSIRYGRAVQGVYNVIEYLIKPIEEHLLEQEQFVEIQEQKRRDALNAEREREIAPYLDFVTANLPITNAPWADMGDKFSEVLEQAKAAKETHEAEQARLEAERIAREKAEAEERERIRKENERLRAERAELEKQQAEERARMEAERKAAEEQAQKERAERERLEAEARKKEEEEKARKAAENEARRRAAAAPDKEKLMAFAAELSAIEVPAVKDKQARRIREELENRMSDIAKWLREEAERL